jgi:hypothetical protein
MMAEFYNCMLCDHRGEGGSAELKSHVENECARADDWFAGVDYSAAGDAFRFPGLVVGFGLYVGAKILNADTGDLYRVTREVDGYTWGIARDEEGNC